MINNKDDYYNVQQVAELFGISTQSVCNLINKDKIKYEDTLKDVRDIRIPKAQFEQINNPTKVFLQRMEEILGSTNLKLSDPSDVFRSGRDVE